MYLVRYSEIALKSEPVRKEWEKRLVENIKDLLDIEDVRRERGRIWIDDEDCDPGLLRRVFGIQSFSSCEECRLDDLEEFLLSHSEEILKNKSSFALSVKRVGTHDFTSQDVAKEMGAKILDKQPHLKVDLTDPEAKIFIEIRERRCYIFFEVIPGIGGLPLGVSGKLVSLFSDANSAIASWMMMKRGCKIIPIFINGGDGSDEGEQKTAEENLALLKSYSPDLDLRVVSFDGTEAPSKKRIYEMAEEMAFDIGAKGIVTGESIVRDRSGTFESLYTIEDTCNIPIYRPLVTFSEEELDKMLQYISS